MELSDARGPFDDDVMAPPVGHRFDGWRVSILALAIAAVVLVAGIGVQREREAEAAEPRHCARVGLSGPSAATPDEALAGYLATAPAHGTPDDWTRSEYGPIDDGTVSYELVGPPRPAAPTELRFVGIQVVEVDGVWTTEVACMG